MWLPSGAVSIAGAVGLQLGGGTSRLEGRVYGEHGQNLPHVQVRLETTGGDLVVEGPSDDQGRYNFGGLRRGVYHVSASTEGYENFRQTVDLTRGAYHTIFDIGMSPLAGAISPGEPPSLTDAQAPGKARREYQKGMQDLASNRIPEAKAHFSKAVEKYPCYARAQTAVALGFVSDRDLAHAEAAFKKSIACDPGYWSAYLKLGELYNVESRFRESEPLLQEGLRRQPGSWKFHFQLGVTYYGLGTYDKAQQEYQLSESLNPPAPPEVHVKLADVYFRERMFGKAYEEMQSYLAAEPDGRFAPKVKDLMRQMDSYRTARAGTSASAPPASAQP
jgi:tetratricopeptide (TPR) repeat protein